MLKKIVLSVFLGFLILGNVSFGQPLKTNENPQQTFDANSLTNGIPGTTQNNTTMIDTNKNDIPDTIERPTTTTELPDDQIINGITIGPKCLSNGQCSISISQLLGIRKSIESDGTEPANATLFVQDIILSATFFIGTIVTIAIIISGIKYVMAGASGKDPSGAKNGLIYSIIGLILVVSSYAIIRLVQYIAKGF